AVALSRYAAADGDEIDWSRFRVEPLRLHESVPLFFAPSRERAGMARGGAIAARGVAKSGPTVLEPEYRPEAQLPASVPPLAHWSRVAASDLPKPAPRQIVTPGRTEAASEGPKLTAPPSPSVPNLESAAADVNISLPAATNQNPSTASLANSATM